MLQKILSLLWKLVINSVIELKFAVETGNRFLIAILLVILDGWLIIDIVSLLFFSFGADKSRKLISTEYLVSLGLLIAAVTYILFLMLKIKDEPGKEQKKRVTIALGQSIRFEIIFSLVVILSARVTLASFGAGAATIFWADILAASLITIICGRERLISFRTRVGVFGAEAAEAEEIVRFIIARADEHFDPPSSSKRDSEEYVADLFGARAGASPAA